MLLEEFLKDVLPNEGIYCWTSIRNKIAQNHFCTSIEELAEQIKRSDAAGVDTYHACASYKSSGSRREGNALGARCVALDIDVGEGKPYATQDQAIQALHQFCDGLRLFHPGVVSSGGGVHAYWCVDATLTPDEFRCIAKQLKLLAASRGLQQDTNARTDTLASILRPPGTKNYKIPGQPRDVTVLTGEFSSRNIKDLSLPLFTNPALPAINSPLASSSNVINSSLSSGLRTSFDADEVVDSGARNSHCYSYACSLLAKQYPHEDIPRLVLKYNSEKCVPPLGEQEVLTTVASAIRGHVEKLPPMAEPSVDESVAEEPLPSLPPDYKWGDANCLVAFIEDENGDKKPRTLSDRPIYLKALTCLEGKDQHNCYLFRSLHKKKGWQEFTLSSEQVNKNDWYAEFAKRGGTINPGCDKYFKLYIRAAERMNRNMDETIQYNQMGWKDGGRSFLIGNSLLHSNGSTTKAAPTPRLKPYADAFNLRGTSEGWSAAADKFTMKDCEPWLAFVVASAAAPLIPFCVDPGNGGCVMSMQTEDSGFAKSPTVRAVSSVWGNMAACRVTGKNTWNRLNEDLARRCNIPTIGDEMGFKDPEVVVKMMRDFADGTTKGRLDRAGNAVGEPEFFQTIFMSMSNSSLYQLVKSVDEPMSKRIFEIEPDRKPPSDIMGIIGNVVSAMEANCGWLGFKMMKIAVHPEVQVWLNQQLRGDEKTGPGIVLKKYWDILASETEHRFITGLLAAIDVMATIINKSGMMEFSHARLMGYLVERAVYIMGRKDTPLGTTETLMSDIFKLDAFLRHHANTVLVVQHPYRRGDPVLPAKEPQRELLMRREMQSDTLYIDQDAISAWCVARQISPRNLAIRLKEIGVLRASSKMVTLGAGTGLGSGKTLCWEVDMGHRLMEEVSEVAQEAVGSNVVPLRK